MVKLWIHKLQENLKRGIYLKYTMHRPYIYNIWYIECDSICDKIGMTKYPWNYFRDTVFMKDTLIEIKDTFP